MPQNRLSGWRYWKFTSRVVAAFRVSSRTYQFVHQASFLIGQVGDPRHADRAEVARLGEDRGVEVAPQLAAARLRPAGVLEVVAEARPAVDLDEQLAQLDQRQPLVDEPLQLRRALRPLLGLQGRDHQGVAFHPDVPAPGEQDLDPVQEPVQLLLALVQANVSVFRGQDLPADLGPEAGPSLAGDQVRLGVGVAAAPLQPDVARPQGPAQLPQDAQLEVVAASGRVGVVVDVRPPPGGDEVERRLVGQDAAALGVEPAEQVHGPQQGRVPRGAEREGVEELGGELAEVGVAALEEVEVVVVGGADDPVRLRDGVPEFGRGDAAVDGPSQVRVPDRGVEDHPADLAEEPDLLVGRRGDREPEVLQVAAGAVVGVGEAVVEQVDGVVGQVDQGLVEEGDEGRITPLFGHPLKGLVRAPARDLGEELQAVRAQRRQVPALDPPAPAEGALLQGDEDRRRRGRGDGLLEPGQAGAAGVGVDGQQAVEPGLAVPGQDRGQPPVGLVLRPLPGRGDEPLQVGDPRPLDPEAEQVLAGQAQEQGGSVVLQGTLHEPAFEPGQVAGRGLAEAEVLADLPEVLGPRLPPAAVPRQLARGDVELPRHEGDDRLGGGAQVVRAEAEEAERTELEGEPQAVGGRGRRGSCLRSARERVKWVSMSPGWTWAGKRSSRSRSASLRKPVGTAVSPGGACPAFSQTRVSEGTRALRGGRRRTGASHFSETILGIDFSPVYGYDEFRER